MELKKIGGWSAAKIATIFGFIAGILSIVFMAILAKLQSNISEELLVASGMPLIELTPSVALLTLGYYVILGFVLGVVIAFLYNLIAKIVGGIKLELIDSKK